MGYAHYPVQLWDEATGQNAALTGEAGQFIVTDASRGGLYIDGKDQPLAQWSGKVLIVNFWATWCGPCREEMPMFVRLQREQGANGLQFVGIAVPDFLLALLGRLYT